MTEKILNIFEIKSKFSEYAKQVMAGKRFIIALRNRPFAILQPYSSSTDTKIKNKPRLKFGVLKGKFDIPDDFNEPLDSFERDFYDD